MSETHDKRVKELETEIERVKADGTRANELWKKHAADLSPEDKKLLLSLLHNHLHGED